MEVAFFKIHIKVVDKYESFFFKINITVATDEDESCLFKINVTLADNLCGSTFLMSDYRLGVFIKNRRFQVW
jgi:hypothetical protein